MLALIRSVSRALGQCELTHLERVAIDVALAEQQHAVYARQLESLGYGLVHVEPAPELPDAVFVEDTAVVFERLAVLTRPGAASRRPEVAGVARALAPLRRLVAIEAPGILDGGDVLTLGRDVYVGRSTRSNDEGIRQLAAAVASLGLRVWPVDLDGCLHLKSAVTQIGPSTLLINDRFVDRTAWPEADFIAVDPDEPYAANALLLNGVVLHPASARATRARMQRAGIEVRPVDVSELEKAEGGVTCCSVLISRIDA